MAFQYSSCGASALSAFFYSISLDAINRYSRNGRYRFCISRNIRCFYNRGCCIVVRIYACSISEG